MSRLNIKVEPPVKPPVTMLHEAKKGSVFFFKTAYDQFGPEAEPYMRLDHSPINSWGEVENNKIACVDLGDGGVVVRHRTTEIVQVNADLLIGAVHGAEK